MVIASGARKGAPISDSLTSRIFLTLLRALLGVVLLSDVSFKATYRELQEFPILQSGLTSMNTSLVQDPDFQYIATGNFWWHFPSMMSYSYPVSPVSCSGAFCQSFFFPGPISLIKFIPDAPAITDADAPLANSFIEQNSPGYQIDFSPVDDVGSSHGCCIELNLVTSLVIQRLCRDIPELSPHPTVWRKWQQQ